MTNDPKIVECLFGHHDIINLPKACVQICSRCGFCTSATGKHFWAKFDASGTRLLYRKFENGVEEWYKYNTQNQLIHFRKNDGFNIEYTYNGNKIPLSKVYIGPAVKFTENPLNT